MEGLATFQKTNRIFVLLFYKHRTIILLSQDMFKKILKYIEFLLTSIVFIFVLM
jgi:hypothetical protein